MRRMPKVRPIPRPSCMAWDEEEDVLVLFESKLVLVGVFDSEEASVDTPSGPRTSFTSVLCVLLLVVRLALSVNNPGLSCVVVLNRLGAVAVANTTGSGALNARSSMEQHVVFSESRVGHWLIFPPTYAQHQEFVVRQLKMRPEPREGSACTSSACCFHWQSS